MTAQETFPEIKKGIFSRLWKRFVLRPIRHQFTRGTSIEKVALAMAVSPVITSFPVLGTTNILTVLVGTMLRLNIPFILLFKTLFYPLHLGMILVFIRIGESMNGAPHIPFSIPQLLGKFKGDPIQFFKEFGMTALYGIEAWAIIAPWFTIPLYFIFLYLLRKYANRKSNSSAV